MSRNFGPHYSDPVDEIWIRTAGLLGMSVVRSSEVFAAWDGQSTLTISTPEGFDPDDCLAQMIFHELCHALVQGPEGRRAPDWGLDNTTEHDLIYEYACHRLQAWLADPFGLRALMAPTTDHRPYYEALPANPLSPGDDPAIALARAALPEARSGPWADAIRGALQATAEVAAVLRRFAPESLWSAALPRHPTGLPPARTDQTCGGCAWRDGARCGRADAPTTADQPACRYWQAPLAAADCAGCGACCRQGFDVVDLPTDSPILVSHPEWAVDHGWGPQLPRPDGHCVALAQNAAPYRCRVYGDRPSGCRDLAVGGDACLLARQRVGLTP